MIKIRPRVKFSYVIIVNRNFNWASTRENLSSVVCEQHRRRPACTDQPGHPRSLTSAFVVGFLERIIRKLASGGI